MPTTDLSQGQSKFTPATKRQPGASAVSVMAPSAEVAGTFHHVPRPPAQCAGSLSGLRRYAASVDAKSGESATSFTVSRFGSLRSARLELVGGFGAVSGCLVPKDLRELARCLIDAAADIEREAA